jgi:hypothetical protein
MSNTFEIYLANLNLRSKSENVKRSYDLYNLESNKERKAELQKDCILADYEAVNAEKKLSLLNNF